MADLIDKQAAIDKLMELSIAREHWISPEGVHERQGINAAICAIEDLPSVDAVEVVRCKDCVNCEYDSIFNQYWCGGSEVISDGFCNYGEREDPLHGAMNPPEDDITDGKGEAK